jgi:hypothetical protein
MISIDKMKIKANLDIKSVGISDIKHAGIVIIEIR